MNAPCLTADDLVSLYLDQIPYEPYRVQEDALLAWFTDVEGILVTAPTGTGKTLIAEAAMFEALHRRKVAYYTTPLIALTEQKFHELQEAAVRWGFSAEDVGLITGNRKVNADAPLKVVVAEILLNRLLHPEQFDFSEVSSVVMDEFHSFNDPERGVVWELSLALLPKRVRLMLLSATVGNAVDFLMWLKREHGRKVQLIQGQERKVPLEFIWGEELLADQLEQMQDGTGENKRTPALVFCFNRAECWTVAEQLKGKKLLSDGQQKELAERIEKQNWKIGAGPKLKQILMRGVGVHHAGMLPKYRRRVEKLFQEKLLSVCVCTETLAAGINLPARSVVMTSLLKGPPGKKKLIEASTAHQIFGRAGRPQFDTRGYVYALAHEDDVKIARWKQQYDQIPEDTKDPNLIRMKKKLKKKMPTRRSNEQYWNEEQFRKLVDAPPGKLESKGELPWRLMAYLIQLSPDVDRLRLFARKRLLPPNLMEKTEQRLLETLHTLYRGGFIDLDPPPENVERAIRDWPVPEEGEGEETAPVEEEFGAGLVDEGGGEEGPRGRGEEGTAQDSGMGTFGSLLQEALAQSDSNSVPASPSPPVPSSRSSSHVDEKPEIVLPKSAYPTERTNELLIFRGCHPLYGAFLLDHLGLADRTERLQILESVLEIPGSLMRSVRVPPPDEIPPGPLARLRIDPELIARGLVTQGDLDPSSVEEETDNFGRPIRRFHVPLGDKLRLLFDAEYPGVRDLRTRSVWIAADVILSGLDYQKFITSRDLTKQEGIVFRHFLRMILLCDEFAQVCPAGTTPEEWRAELDFIRHTLSRICHEVDPESTDKALESMLGADITQG
jgi:superfamily II DNA/RNA helicase